MKQCTVMFICEPVTVEPEFGKLNAFWAAHESKWMSEDIVDSWGEREYFRDGDWSTVSNEFVAKHIRSQSVFKHRRPWRLWDSRHPLVTITKLQEPDHVERSNLEKWADSTRKTFWVWMCCQWRKAVEIYAFDHRRRVTFRTFQATIMWWTRTLIGNRLDLMALRTRPKNNRVGGLTIEFISRISLTLVPSQ